MKEKFRIIARDETHAWDQSVLDEFHITKAFCLYAIREGEATHCCSLTPSSWAVAIENVFIHDFDLDPSLRAAIIEENHCLSQNWQGYETDVLESLRDRASDKLSYEAIDESSCYLDFVRDADNDPFVSGPVTFTFHTRDYKGGSKGTAYHDAIWQAAEEYFRQEGIPVVPILELDFNTGIAVNYLDYEAAEVAKRRAENKEPLAISDNQLPLFVAAARRLPEAMVVSARGWVSEWTRRWYESHPEELAEADQAKGLA